MTTRSVDTVIREAGDKIRQALHQLADSLGDDQGATEYMTPHQAAAELFLDVQTIYRMTKDGRLPSKKVGRRTLIPAEAVREL